MAARVTPSVRQVRASFDPEVNCSAGRSDHTEVGDVPPLPRRFDRAGVVVLPDERHSLASRHAVQHGDARKGRASSAPAAAAGDFHALGLGAAPGFTQRLVGVATVSRQSKVGPSNPACFPRDWGRARAQEVDGVVRGWAWGE